ncbi:MlaD family protein [Nocardia goodfellowii]
MTRIPAWLSAAILVVVTALGATYLVVGVLGATPGPRLHAVVDMRETGGLRAGSDVVYRGVNIGRVDDIWSVPGGVRLRLSYDADHRIPAALSLRVENLSALGEPVFAFLPESQEGPWLEDYARLSASVAVPASVPELLESTSQLLDQTDSAALARLTDSFTQSLAGLEAATPVIGHAADLLLITLIRHQPSLEAALRNLNRIMSDVDWVKPVMISAPPQLDAFGATLGESYEYLFDGSALLRGDEVLSSWRAEEAQLVEFLQRFSPEVGALGVALRPVSAAVGPALGMVDFATFLDQVLATLPGDRLRLILTAPR